MAGDTVERWLTVLQRGYYPARLAVEVSPAPARGSASVVLRRGGQLTVRCVDARGRVVPQAEIAIVDDENRDHFDDRVPHDGWRTANPFPAPRTRDDGTLVVPDLKPGHRRVFATLEGRRTEEVEVMIVAEQARLGSGGTEAANFSGTTASGSSATISVLRSTLSS